RADCLLLYGWGDIATARHFIKQGAPEQQAGRNERLRVMQRYAESKECRRRVVLRYFDDSAPSHECELCDICLNDMAGAARAVFERKTPRQSKIQPFEYDPALFEILRGVRRAIAQETEVPAFVVFSDRSLMAMAAAYPRTDDEFLSIHGVGERKAAI